MTLFRRLLLLPCLLPLLAVLVVSAMNRSSTTQLQVLIWRSPALPLGAWTAIAAAAGASMSGVAALLLLPGRAPLRRTLHQPVGRTAESNPEPFDPRPPAAVAPPGMPERDLRDPAPTVAVPYRVIQRPQTSERAPDSKRDAVDLTASDRDARDRDARDWDASDWDRDPDRDW